MNAQRKKKKGIDVSRWNPIKDYDAVRDSGVEFAIVKVNNAGNVPDARFYEHVAGFRAAGTPMIAGYSYLYANTEEKAKRGSSSFVEIAEPQGIKTMVADIEDPCMRGLGSKILPIIDIYKTTAEEAGMNFLIYTGASFYNPCLKPFESELIGLSWWWARYPNTKDKRITDPIPDTKNLPKHLDLDGWQYSSKLKVNGCSGYLDVNVWFETEPFCNKLEEIPVEYNPFDEPTGNVTLGVMGESACWVRWYLWQFGMFGNVDGSVVYGMIDEHIVVLIKRVQEMLGLEPDGIVGKCTKAVWRKIC